MQAEKLKKVWECTVDGQTFSVFESENKKALNSETHKYLFNKQTGLHIRWGKTREDNPEWGLPEIADIEISEVCSGVNGKLCKFCYKSNSPKGSNMSLETFKAVFSNLPKSVTQIALGIGDISGNPDLKSIIEHCRDNGVIPNITINGDGLTDEFADFFAKNLGAIAVSFYDKDVCFDAIKKLTDRGMNQVNIHFVINKERLQSALDLISLMGTDSRVQLMNAVVWLSIKPKGRAKETYDPLNSAEFSSLMNKCRETGIRYGMDSCSAQKFISYAKDSIEDKKELAQIEQVAEPCESTCFSMYINWEGKFFPCSFLEDEDFLGIDCTKPMNFIEEVWMHEKTIEARNQIVGCHKCGRSCFKYEL